MTRLTVCLLCWVGLTVGATAQQAPAAAGSQSAPQARPGAAGGENALFFRLSRQMDANGDLLVDEKEFAAGFAKLEKEAAKVRAELLVWLDKDKNGVLSPEELKPLETLLALLPLIRSFDQSGDASLQEPELDTAFTRMAEVCQGANEQMLEQFDRNRDGKLGDDELQVARQGLQRPPPRTPRAAGATPEGRPVAAGGARP